MNYVSNMVVDRNLNSFDLIIEERLITLFSRNGYEFARHSFVDQVVSISYVEKMDLR